jgi:serine/threonine-protein kinase
MTGSRPGSSASAPESLTPLGDAACDRFEAAWRAGQRPRIEDHLAAVPEPERPALLRELILLEVDYRRLAGERPRAEEYLERFPVLDGISFAVRLSAAVPPAPRPLADSNLATVIGESETGNELKGLAPGYEILGELGRGGMGIVYKARDPRLNRLVALKMLRPGGRACPEELARFRHEAAAAARLQHPHIVQIYEVGESGGCPFFAMEWVEGGSLDRKLRGAPLPPRDAARLVATLARAVHAAHQRGLVHRDLKPANVLLTAEGLPKVADFGLAKRLDAGAGETKSGVILGTPSYMAPEQAQGRPSAVTPLTDVYALGAVLYEVLTGRPPFRAATTHETLQQVLDEDPVPPRRLLPKTPRDLETVCLKCLRKEPHQRYASAAALAEDLERYLAGEPIVARPVGRVERLLKWARRRPAAAGLWPALTLLLALGVGVAWSRHLDHAAAEARRQLTDQEARLAMQRARELLDAAWQAPDPTRALAEARAAADRAAAVADSGEASADVRHEAAALRRRVAARIDQAQKNGTLLTALLDVQVRWVASTYRRNEHGQLLTRAEPSVDEQFTAAFLHWGVDVDNEPVAQVVARLTAQPAPFVQDVVAGLDAWALERRRQHARAEWRRLVDVARQLDQDDLRKEARELLAAGPLQRTEATAAAWDQTRDRLRQLAGPAADARTALGTLALARVLVVFGEERRAEGLLRSSVAVHAGEVSLLQALGQILEEQRPPRLAEAIEYYRTARAVRAELGLALGRALVQARRAAEGEEVLVELLRRQLNHPQLHLLLGNALQGQRQWAKAEAAFRKAVALRRDSEEAHYFLGYVLYQQGKLDDAETAYRTAVGLKPHHVYLHVGLGHVLLARKNTAEAETVFRKAIDLNPKDAAAHYGLGKVLYDRGTPGAAAAALRAAIGLEPDHVWAHYYLGLALLAQQQPVEAEAAFRKATHLEPDFATAYHNLGVALRAQQKLIAAEAAFRRALDYNPDLAGAYQGLGQVLHARKRPAEAEAAYLKAIDRKVDFPQAYHGLGMAYRAQGKLAEAMAAFATADRHPLGQPVTRKELQRTQRWVGLEKRFPALLEDGNRPKNPGELYDLADFCFRCRRHYAAAARCAADAFAADPKLADDLYHQHRYYAACAALLAAAGRGADADRLDPGERDRLRRQALDWLLADLALWANRMKGGPAAQTGARHALLGWQQDPDLAGVRDPRLLAELPSAQRQAWSLLWLDVEVLLGR